MKAGEGQGISSVGPKLTWFSSRAAAVAMLPGIA
jgi:hypothetical protein